ncbi:MAG: polysaccharide biosynthesis protein, partial [Azonexus sp.]
MKNKTTKLVPFSNPRTFAAFAHDVAAAMLAWLLAYWLRFNFDVPVDYAQAARVALIWLVPLFAGLFYLFGLYRGLWRFASISDLH